MISMIKGGVHPHFYVMVFLLNFLSIQETQAQEIKEIDFVQVNAFIQVGANEKALSLLPLCVGETPQSPQDSTETKAQETKPQPIKAKAKDKAKAKAFNQKQKSRYTPISNDENLQAKLRILRAQALIALGNIADAEKCLAQDVPAPYQTIKRILECKHLKNQMNLLWADFQNQSSAQAEPSKIDVAKIDVAKIDVDVFDRFIECAKPLLNAEQVHDKHKDEIELNLALAYVQKGSILKSNAFIQQGIQQFRSLINTSSDENIRASALGGWAEFSDDEAPRRSLWIHFGDSPQARALASNPPKISASEIFTRGQKLFEDRAYDLIFSTFNLLLENPDVDSLTKQKSALMSAQTYLRIFDEEEKTDRLLDLVVTGPDPELVAQAWFDRAILWGRQGRWDEALRGMREYATRMPKTTRAREARYQKGRLLHQAGRYEEAVVAHEAFMNTKPSDNERFRWFWGWSYYRMKNCKKAIEIWSKIEDHQNLLVGPKVHYWKAKCAHQAGNQQLALKEIGLVRKMESMSYYGVLAQALESEIKGKEIIWPRAVPRTEMGAKPNLQTYLKKLGDAHPLAVKINLLKDYSEIGVYHLARKELRLLCGEHLKPNFQLIPKLGKPKSIQLCKDLHHWVNEEGSLWKIGDAQKLPWYSGLAKKTVEVQQAAYPPAYLDQAIASASLENDQISPWWILGHMLQESRYRTGVVSGAGAVGLMQILPRTGRLIWEIVKWPKEEFYRARLYESGLSVRYGTWYLMRLYEDLKHPIWAMAAYNGGPLRMVEHINKHLHLPFDEVLEEFGSHESRNYARKITDHFVRYLHMYASEEDRLFWTRKLLPPKQVAKPDENVKF